MNNKKQRITIALISFVLLSGMLTGYVGNTATGEAREKLDLAVKYLNENQYQMAILAYGEGITIAYRQAFERMLGISAQSDQVLIKTTTGVTVNPTYLGPNRGFKVNINPSEFSNDSLKQKAKYWKFDFSPMSRTESTDKLNRLLASGGGSNLKTLGANITEEDITIGTAGAFYVQVIFLAEDKSAVGFFETPTAVVVE